LVLGWRCVEAIINPDDPFIIKNFESFSYLHRHSRH
jgi:hypothetical protein